MSTNKATIIFTDDNDGSLSVQILFEPEQPSKESNAHVAAILAHQYIVQKVDEAYEDESAK
jgi:hypothetical protein